MLSIRPGERTATASFAPDESAPDLSSLPSLPGAPVRAEAASSFRRGVGLDLADGLQARFVTRRLTAVGLDPDVAPRVQGLVDAACCGKVHAAREWRYTPVGSLYDPGPGHQLEAVRSHHGFRSTVWCFLSRAVRRPGSLLTYVDTILYAPSAGGGLVCLASAHALDVDSGDVRTAELFEKVQDGEGVWFDSFRLDLDDRGAYEATWLVDAVGQVDAQAMHLNSPPASRSTCMPWIDLPWMPEACPTSAAPVARGKVSWLGAGHDAIFRRLGQRPPP